MQFALSVREIVDFACRTGGLGGQGMFASAQRAQEGTRGHRRLQQSRPGDYEAEVAIRASFSEEGFVLHISGRMDGIWPRDKPPLIEEIKTVSDRWDGREDPLHRAQLRLYAALAAREHGWLEVKTRLVYLNWKTDEEVLFPQLETKEALAEFLDRVLGIWRPWLRNEAARLRQRNASVANLAFPLGSFRADQRTLSRSVYRTIRDGGRLFIEAPTGLGKTMGVLYPAARALPRLGSGKCFYLTAKNSGRLAAEKALADLGRAGAVVRSITLVAREKACFSETPGGCDVRTCPYAEGYFDRVKPALEDLLVHRELLPTQIEAAARAHRVCPFELALDASEWCDFIIADYNYAFDPSVRLQRHFQDRAAAQVLLVDEAHNLVDRSRDMHSASLTIADLTMPHSLKRARGATRAKRAVAAACEAWQVLLNRWADQEGILIPREYHQGAKVFTKAPEEEEYAALRNALRELERFLESQPPGSDLGPWLVPFFAIHGFFKALEKYDETCCWMLHATQGWGKISCLDPSSRLTAFTDTLRSAVFFSATLSPAEFFQGLLGGKKGDPRIVCRSPFRAEQVEVGVASIDVTYRSRAESLPRVASLIGQWWRERPGNALLFCPSIDYLGSLADLLEEDQLPVYRQTASMTEPERAAFLSRLEEGKSAMALAVLGGIFAEGVDLPGDRLTGVAVIGVGLPALSLERDALQYYFEKTRRAGFDYAYGFPGMNRVLQAVGRLIRTEQDQGRILLVDQRYAQKKYRELLPSWWNEP